MIDGALFLCQGNPSLLMLQYACRQYALSPRDGPHSLHERNEQFVNVRGHKNSSSNTPPLPCLLVLFFFFSYFFEISLRSFVIYIVVGRDMGAVVTWCPASGPTCSPIRSLSYTYKQHTQAGAYGGLRFARALASSTKAIWHRTPRPHLPRLNTTSFSLLPWHLPPPTRPGQRG